MISMFSLVAWECVLAAPVSERRGALSLIFILLKLRIVESFTRRYESYLCLRSEGNQRTRQQCGACGVAVGRRPAGCGDAQHILFVFVSGERGGPKHPGLGSECSLPYLYKVP